MMAEAVRDEHSNFLQNLTSFYQDLSGQDPLERYRSTAWDHFLDLGLPDVHAEVFKYVRLRQLFSEEYSLAASENIVFPVENVYPECSDRYFVFLNGFYRPDLSLLKGVEEKIIGVPLEQGAKTYGAFLRNRWNMAIKEEQDPFAVLNGALHRGGLFLYIPPKTILKQPIQLIFRTQADEKLLIVPRVQIYMGSGSEATMILSHEGPSVQNCFVNQVTDIVLDDNAKLNVLQVGHREHPNAWHFDALRAMLKRDSRLEVMNLSMGSQRMRSDYHVDLVGENADAALNGLWILEDNREFHTHVFMDHQAPHCHSMQFFKGVLDGKSRSSFEGKIMVRQPAQKTDAYQLNKNLILSEQAHADSKPNLEIFADDVKASHGATVGRLDEEHLFYMKTRGFSDIEAKSLLVYGYCQEMIDKIGISSIRQEFTQVAKDILHGF